MSSHVRPGAIFAAVAMAVAACSGDIGDTAPNGADEPAPRVERDLDALERAKYGHQACAENSECPTGSRCEANLCTWDCLSDTECGNGHFCDALGQCVASTLARRLEPSAVAPALARNADACLAMDPAAVRAALVGLNLESPPRSCNPGASGNDDGCPCGSYCNNQSQCHVDCLDEANPPAGLACATGQKCTPSGRCVPTASTIDDPPATESLEIDPGVISANTAAGAVLVPVTVRLHTNGQAALQDPNPTKVRYHIAGVGDVGMGNPPGDSAASFSRATGSVVNFGDNFGLTGNAAFSLEAWLRPASFPVNDTEVLFAKVDASNGYYVEVATNLIRLVRRSSGAQAIAATSVGLPAGSYSHLVIAYDGSTARFYVNGALVASPAIAQAVGTTTSVFTIGRPSTGGFDGDIDEPAIYGVALSASQVLAHFNARNGLAYRSTILADNPLSYWRFGEAAGSPIAANEIASGPNGSYTGVLLGMGGAIAGPAPLVKCAESAALAASCEIAGGWRFHLGTGSLESDPRTIWVQIPHTDAATRWTLLAQSESAAVPGTAVVRSQATLIPSTDPGHYTGAVSWTNSGGDGSALTLPVEAFVTANAVALYDPAKLLLPEGHAVFPRDPTKATLLAWLTSSVSGANAEYDVRVDLGAFTYNATTGHLAGGLSLTTGAGAAATAFTLSLDRSDGPSTPACGTSCAAGTYCEAATSTCLPGSGPAVSTIVAASAAVASKMLSSAAVATWAPVVATLRRDPQNPSVQSQLLGASGEAGFGQAYCYQPAETQATQFAPTRTIRQPSQDFGCVQGTAGAPEFAQTTFPFENRTTQVTLDSNHAQTFNLFRECLKDLAVAPPAGPTIANTLDIAPPRNCANLAQFYLALKATEAVAPNDEATAKLVAQALRQWLAVNTLVANGAVQNRNYDDVLGVAHPVPGTTDDTPQGRLGYALDLVDSGLRVMLDPAVRPQLTGPVGNEVELAPDYRTSQQRPKHRWTFNGTTSTTIHDAEGNIDFVTTGVAPANDALFAKNATSATCQTASPVALNNDRFTISFYLMGDIQEPTRPDCCTQPKPVTVFEKTAADGSWVRLDMTEGLSFIFVLATYLDFTLSDSNGGKVILQDDFEVPAFKWGFPPATGSSLIAVTVDNTTPGGPTFQVLHGSAGGSRVGGRPIKWGAPGIVKFACNVPDHADFPNQFSANGLTFDEISLWSRPISDPEFRTMVSNYGNNVHSQILPSTTPPPGQEQGVSLAVHLLESANADLALVHDYVQAERGISYPECFAGGASPARDRAMARAGRNLRLVSVLEAEAERIAALPNATNAPWFPRYQAARQTLAGTRASVMQVIRQMTACENPLGISEAVLPLYVGQTTGASERFFASTRFLTAMATDGNTGPLHLAAAARADAQSSYNQQVVSDFQRDLVPADKNDAIEKLKIAAEQTLRKYCGLPSTGEPTGSLHSLYDQFEAGTLDAQTCYLKTEIGGACRPFVLMNTPLEQVAPECLRGQLGELVVAIQSAGIDLKNAKDEESRDVMKLGLDTTYCLQRERDLAKRNDILVAQQSEIDAAQRNALEGEEIFSMWSTAVLTFTGLSSFNPTSFLSFADRSAKYADDTNNAMYNVMIAKADADLAVKDCFHQADNTKFAIDAAHGTIARAAHQSVAAMQAFMQAQDDIDAALVASRGQVGLERNLDRTPPHLTFWVDEKIAAYAREMAYARRILYLAVRAYEYESQQSSPGMRAQVLSARKPDDLQAVVDQLNSHTAPFADNDPNFRAQSEPEVFSLRTELLRIQDLSRGANLLPGDPPRTDIDIFKALLASDATKMYTANGVYRGHGIRFTMRPGPWSAEKCAERLSRIVPLIQTDAPQGLPGHPNVTLIQMNEFGSQQCTTSSPAPLRMARAGAAVNLVGTDTTADLRPPAPSQEIGLSLAPTTILDRQQLLRDVPMGDPSAFAGRGVYGEYILLFPADDQACSPSECRGWSEDAIAQVKDVLLRFEMVDGQRQVH